MLSIYNLPQATRIVTIMSSTDPRDLDDGWADLARELGLESGGESPRVAVNAPQPVSPGSEPDPRSGADENNDAEGWVELEEVDVEALSPADDTALPNDSDAEEGGDVDDGEDDEEGSSEGSDEDSVEPGTKKRRRRRRRRKKKSPEEAGPIAESSPVETARDASDESDLEQSANHEGGIFDPEEVSPEMTRELIRTWNVPSWEEIVAGLYRPQDR